MKAEEVGYRIAQARKKQGMTQRELSERLHVSDKAVSKWERGLGFPDINTIEPLADALGVSVLEIMRSERIAETEITQDTASAALTDIFEFVKLSARLNENPFSKSPGALQPVYF